jgi:GTPase Era involved in 16S rRNA processing
MRGLKPKSFGAAKVGVVECTMSVNEYPDIKNPNLIYYDLPGVGTSNYPRNEYFKIIKSQTKNGIEFQDFDFFLIVSATRFTEDDIWLSQQIQKGGKQFYFVRTKIDFDLANAREDDPDNYDEVNVLQEIRDNCLKELMKVSMVNSASYEDRVFLLSTKLIAQEKWDFSKMVRSLLHDYPALKRDAMVLSVTSYCKDVIREKANVLRNEIWKIALASAIGAIVPISGLGAVIDYNDRLL